MSGEKTDTVAGRLGKGSAMAPRFSFYTTERFMVGRKILPEIKWWPRAACRGTLTPDLWFPDTGAPSRNNPQVAQACAICDCCEVRSQCLAYALEANETTGIWGGTLPQDRKRTGRQREITGEGAKWVETARRRLA